MSSQIRLFMEDGGPKCRMPARVAPFLHMPAHDSLDDSRSDARAARPADDGAAAASEPGPLSAADHLAGSGAAADAGAGAASGPAAALAPLSRPRRNAASSRAAVSWPAVFQWESSAK